MAKTRSLSHLIFSAALMGLMTAPALAQNKTIEMKRQTFQPDYWKVTAHGEATLVAANVKSDVGSDIAFAALNDSLTFVASGSASPAAGFLIGKGISEITNGLRDTDVQFSRLAKFPSLAGTFLNYDDGSWCRIPGGGDLDHIERDSLEPMERFDIPPEAANEICRSPDGFYQDNRGTIFFLYSSSPQDKSWMGIGFGDSYCAVANPTDWLTIANLAFPSDRDKRNIRQGTKFELGSPIEPVARGRTWRGQCGPNAPASFQISLKPDQQIDRRTILYNDHWTSTGHGAALFYAAKTGNALGDALASDAVGFLAGYGGDAMAAFGTSVAIFNAVSEPDTTLPRMAKRANSSAVYLQRDDNSWCFMDDPKMLSIIKADGIEVHVTNSIPGNIQPGRAPVCGYPDGYYKIADDNVDQVYYLYSASKNEPSWYGIGMGSKYCYIRNEDQWRELIRQAGGNAGSPQDSLHRIADLNFLTGRQEVTQCPARMRDGVALN